MVCLSQLQMQAGKGSLLGCRHKYDRAWLRMDGSQWRLVDMTFALRLRAQREKGRIVAF
jgi:hypothetical protein